MSAHTQGPTKRVRRKLHLHLACGHDLHLWAENPEIVAAKPGRRAACAECETMETIIAAEAQPDPRRALPDAAPDLLAVMRDADALLRRIEEYELHEKPPRHAGLPLVIFGRVQMLIARTSSAIAKAEGR